MLPPSCRLLRNETMPTRLLPPSNRLLNNELPPSTLSTRDLDLLAQDRGPEKEAFPVVPNFQIN